MGKIVVITGGSDGLGKAIAETLAPGYKVVIIARDRRKLEKVAKKLRCKFLVCDIVDPEQVRKTVGSIIRKFGRIDCLINNAGVFDQGTLEDSSLEMIRQTVDINIFGTIVMTKAVLPGMKKNKSGLIININSQAGLYAKAERSIYNASKWAVTGFTKCMQQELFGTGVRMAGIYPAMMKTEIFKKAGIEKDLSKAIEPREVAKIVEFMLEQDEKVLMPEVGVLYNTDN